MKKRMALMLGLVAVFLAAVGTIKVRQVRAGIAQNSSFQPPPEAVTTTIARDVEWPANLTAIGSAVAVQGVTVSADLPGVVDTIAFESGRMVKEGTVLATLDTRQERAQLDAAEAQLNLSRLSLKRARDLRESGVLSQADLDRALAEQTQGEARVGEIKATIERKTVRAPFSGILGIRHANLGQYLAAGDRIVSLQSLDPIYVNFSVPQQEVGRVKIGAAVRVTSQGAAGPPAELTGRVTALDSIVDEATRNVQVQATLPNPGGALRPGMFVETELLLGTTTAVIALPASAISYAPYGDSVFVVAEMKNPAGVTYRGAQQQFVKLGRSRGDQVAVLSGLTSGQEVVTSGVFKLRPGAAVEVNNTVQPGNDPAPKPQDS
ncbi:MAG TPA: efflux RND transporter periplasmic adaptor subunit [Thermoanaerobaculia bacterium]|nr:efflux RND transporter periplasmic adaptor subunit [Thermoanaerobaculia bacterium]